MQFKELNIIPEILKSLEKENYTEPTPIQEKAIPVILSGRDLLGCAQTGTGKTAAFAIPTLQLLCGDRSISRKIRVLIITPTRELALQIYDSYCTYGRFTNLTYGVIFGGVSQKPQEEVLKQGVDVLVATPGRLIDLINQKLIDLNHIKTLILDEADRMLDMGFINDVNKIVAKIPVNRQTLLFSATMPTAIASMAASILKSPAKIAITPVSSTVDTIQQSLYYVDKENKKNLLLHLLKDKSIDSVLVFTRTKHGADRIVRQLDKVKVKAQAIHGDKSQGARQLALSSFKNRSLRILVATDIAARGIDIDELSHVINYDVPSEPETYVHRIGRTGRAGLSGVAITFCDFDEKPLVADIESLIRKRIPEVKEHPFPLVNNFPAVKTTQPRKKPNQTEGTGNEEMIGTKEVSESSIPVADRRKAIQKLESSSKNKMRMTADGTLKEKKSKFRGSNQRTSNSKTSSSKTSNTKNSDSRDSKKRKDR